MTTPVLEIRLLGELELRLAGEAFPPPESARAQSLLAYLVLNARTPQSRHRLAFLLWPDSTEAQALTNLRHQLHNLRRALPEPDRCLVATKRTLWWHPSLPVWVDVEAFANSVSAPPDAGDEAARLEEALALYRGDLLAGNQDEWLVEYREQIRQRYLGAVERLASVLEARGESTRAIPLVERLIRNDPLREDRYRRLMALHAARGERARALSVYHQCASTLQSELGIDPSTETKRLYSDLLASTAHLGQPPGVSSPPASRALVGRSRHWGWLRSIWDEVLAGRRRMALVTGEPGIGKTRLVEEFLAWCASTGALVAEARSYALEGPLLYGPVVDWLRSPAFSLRIGQLSPGLMAEVARLLPELRADAPAGIPTENSRQLLFDALAQVFGSAEKPVLLLADDLHWADRSTMQFLHYLMRLDRPGRLLVLGTARDEDLQRGHPLSELVTSLARLDALAELELERLSAQQTVALAADLSGRPLGEEKARALFERTEGNPLFVVEDVRAGWTDSSSREAPTSPKIQSVIELRLNQLSHPARDLVEVAATIGRMFSVGVLAAASRYGDELLVTALDELWRRRIVRERGAGEYDFSHDRIREVVYGGLGGVRLRHLHLRVARAFEELSAGDGSVPEPSQLAFHYERAGRWEEAAGWYRRAAAEAHLAHAFDEALGLLSRALKNVPNAERDTEKGRRIELSLLLAELAPLLLLEGSTSLRLTAVQHRAWEVTHLLDEMPAAPLLRSLALTDLSLNRFDAAVGMGRLLAERADATGEQVLRVESDYVLGISAFWQGDFPSARRHFEAAVAGYQSDRAEQHRLSYGVDPKVVCLSRLGNTLWFLGRPLAAGRARDEALAFGKTACHRASLETAQVFAAMLSLELRDLAGFRIYASALSTHDGGQPVRSTMLTSRAFRGYLDVIEGNTGPGLEAIENTLQEVARSPYAPGAHFAITRLLLDAYRSGGDPVRGVEAADRAIRSGDGLQLWEPETRRMKADLLSRIDPGSDQIEEELALALKVARRQGAVSMEVRVAATLLSHRIQHGVARVDEARELLESSLARIPTDERTPELAEVAGLLVL